MLLNSGLFQKLKTALIIVLFLILLSPAAFCNTPLINRISPRGGGPGTVVCISGENFGPDSAGSVYFGSVKAEIISWSDKTIEAVVPTLLVPSEMEEKGKKKKESFFSVKVETPAGACSNQVHFNALPGIKKISPHKGGPGSKIVIYGENFGEYIDMGRVYIGTVSCKVEKWSEEEIICLLPDKINPEEAVTEKKGREYFNIYVQSSNLKSNGREFSWTPSISGFSPHRAGAGTAVTILGDCFGRKKDSATIRIAGATVQPEYVEDGKIQFIIPGDMNPEKLEKGKAWVSVNIGGVESNKKEIEVFPVLYSLGPGRSRGGLITITGYNFGEKSPENKVIIKPAEGSRELKFEVLTWNDDLIEIVLPENGNDSEKDMKYLISIRIGNLNSDEKEFLFLKKSR